METSERVCMEEREGCVCVCGGASFMNANVAFEAWVWGGGEQLHKMPFYLKPLMHNLLWEALLTHPRA